MDMKKLMFSGLFFVSDMSGIAFAQKNGDDKIKANVVNFKFAAGENAIVTAKKGGVEASGNGVLIRLDDAVLDVVGGYPVRIANGIYDPRSKTLRVNGSVKVLRTNASAQQSLGEPVDAHDEPIDLTCKKGKLQRNGIPTPKSSTCIGEGARMTCNADDSATFNFSDPTCSGFQDPAG
jgi:hypothetical protein